MEMKQWDIGEFANGTNVLPKGFHWNVVSGGGPVVQVSLDARWGTRLEEPRNPSTPILHIPTDWENLIRLAVQIAHMAQAVATRQRPR